MTRAGKGVRFSESRDEGRSLVYALQAILSTNAAAASEVIQKRVDVEWVP